MKMDQIKNWLAEHNLSSHSIAGGLLAAATLYSTNSEVFGLVNSSLAAHPKILAWVTVLAGVVLKYSGSHSTQGQVAIIASAPPQQVADAVLAVKAAEAPPVPTKPDMQNVVAAAAAKDNTPKA
jgi:hypothetical protein